MRKDIPYLTESKFSNSLLLFYITDCNNVGTNWGVNIYKSASFSESSLTWNSAQNLPGDVVLGDMIGMPPANNWVGDYVNIISNAYCLKPTPSNVNGVVNFASREDPNVNYRPTITHYLNKFHQNTDLGYFYMQTDTSEMLNAISPNYGSNYLIIGDTIKIDCETKNGEQLKLKLWNDGVCVKEFEFFPEESSRQWVEIMVDGFVEFDQMSINGLFDDTDYFKCWEIDFTKSWMRSFNEFYFDNSPPEISRIRDKVEVDGDVIYTL